MCAENFDVGMTTPRNQNVLPSYEECIFPFYGDSSPPPYEDCIALPYEEITRQNLYPEYEPSGNETVLQRYN